MNAEIPDVLVLGSGPAALCIASEFVNRGVVVEGISPKPVKDPWANTYGIWAKELQELGLEHLLGHRWTDSVGYFGSGGSSSQDKAKVLGLEYGLFDNEALQSHWLSLCQDMNWHQDSAQQIFIHQNYTSVLCSSGRDFHARLVVDASGHKSPHTRRPDNGPIAGQSAYGFIGRFSIDPIEKGRFVLMDYRCDHLSQYQRKQPPTFLYAMDLGDGLFFLEETSLALAPAMTFEVLKERLSRRLLYRGVEINEIMHEEFCLFPMNLPLPNLRQPILAFGAAASMVHPASGYMVGSLLRRGPALAEKVSAALLENPKLGPSALAQRGWQSLWPFELVLRHQLYIFGLNRLMSFNESLLRCHFDTFLKLPVDDWSGFLLNNLSLPRLMIVMIRLFNIAPWKLRRSLILGVPLD